MPYMLNNKLKDLQPYDPIAGNYSIRLDANESFLELPMELLEKAQVVGTPGEGFGACGEGYFRFSTFGSPEETQEAARRIVAVLKEKK